MSENQNNVFNIKGKPMNNSSEKLIRNIMIFVGLFVLIFWLSPFVMIGAGERGVVTKFGAVQNKVLGEGIHFRLPLVENVIKIDVKTQKTEVDAPSFSKDIQNVNTTIALNFHLDPSKVHLLWQEIGSEYQYRIIAPAIQESVKAATAKFTAADLVSERPRVKEEITKALVDRLSPRYILVDDFSIVNFDFSDAYENAVEEKQVAQQKSLKAENDLKRITIEAEQRIAQAKGEAEAIKIQSEALKENQDLIQLEAVKRWNGQLPQYMMGESSVPFIQIPSGKNQ